MLTKTGHQIDFILILGFEYTCKQQLWNNFKQKNITEFLQIF